MIHCQLERAFSWTGIAGNDIFQQNYCGECRVPAKRHNFPSKKNCSRHRWSEASYIIVFHTYCVAEKTSDLKKNFSLRTAEEDHRGTSSQKRIIVDHYRRGLLWNFVVDHREPSLQKIVEDRRRRGL